MSEAFSRILSQLREERGVTQRTAAAALHISQALLSHYENGLREPGLAFVDAACRYYQVSADYLLGRSAVRVSFSGTEELPPRLRELADSGMETLYALIAGLRDRPECTEAVFALMEVQTYRLMRPFDREEPTWQEDARALLLEDAAAGLLALRLQAEGAEQGLRFRIPEALRQNAQKQLAELQNEWC